MQEGVNDTAISARLLGEFDVRVNGCPVSWIRRKDALLFRYLLLEPLGRAARSELCDAFWPDHDRQQAAQNLRTTCSNVRAALRRALPAHDADSYFYADGGNVVVRADLTYTDLTRFMASVHSGRTAMVSLRFAEAIEAYESARSLYRGPLIADPATPAHRAIADEVEAAFGEVQRHLTALRLFAGDSPALRASAASA
jgi:DNA-binding SARP family transcriptional activator